jgi:glucosylceramidase
VWVTTGDKSQLLKQQSDLVFQPGQGAGGTAISVNSAITFQSVSGFGAAMTDSSAWLLQNKMTAAQRDKLMRQLFSRDGGIGLNYLRVPMGASDFTASGFYTYNDNPPGGTDAEQQHFSIAHDQAYIIPRLQQAKELNPALKLMASPWSAPAWMKTNHSLLGGSLAPQWEASYAVYLKKMLEAYEDAGLGFDTFSIQNEPQHAANYPSMLMTAAQQKSFIKNHLGPLLSAEGISTKLLAYDHNWDTPEYPIEVLNDAGARQYVAGSAFHAYDGNVSAQTTVHNAHPDKDIYFTEITGFGGAPNFAENLVWNYQNIIIGGTRNWAKTALLWNLALDQNSNPHQGGCSDCRGVVTINNSTGAVTYNEEFYVLGQVTEAVQSNAVRISSTTTGAVNTVAFLNPDGSQALIALNPSSAATSFRVIQGGQHFTYQLPGKSVATFLWSAQGADFDNGAFDDGGFHLGGGSLDAWAVFGNSAGNVSAANDVVLSGDRSLKLFGQSNGLPNVSGVSQGITVAAGDRVHANLSALVRSGESLDGTDNAAQMKIEFYEQYGAVYGSPSFIEEVQVIVADATSPTDAWTPHAIAAMAPEGAVEARLVLQFMQSGDQPGAVHIDNVSFARSLPGDFDGDGLVGDEDFALWEDNFGMSGDFPTDGDLNGHVDGADFLLWQRNFSQGNAVTSATIVLEPTTWAMLLGGTLAGPGWRKDRRLLR